MIDDDENAHREGEKAKKDERKTKDGKKNVQLSGNRIEEV